MHIVLVASASVGEELGEGKLGQLESMVRTAGKRRLVQTSGGPVVQSASSRTSCEDG